MDGWIVCCRLKLCWTKHSPLSSYSCLLTFPFPNRAECLLSDNHAEFEQKFRQFNFILGWRNSNNNNNTCYFTSYAYMLCLKRPGFHNHLILKTWFSDALQICAIESRVCTASTKTVASHSEQVFARPFNDNRSTPPIVTCMQREQQ